MNIEIRGTIPVTCDCGNKIQIPIARMESEFECPSCGNLDKFTDDQINSFKAQISSAANGYGRDATAKSINASIKKTIKGSSVFKQRKK